MKLSSIEEAILDLSTGKMIIVVDDENRENEGDIVIAAESVTPEIINTMIKMSSGLICVPIDEEIAGKLGLETMVKTNTAHYGVNFTVSIDAAKGISTGASAADKAVTIQKMVTPEANQTDFVSPGHIFPLVAKKGGVLVRNGHTEAAVDLVKYAGFQGVAVITEITNQDGSMARLPQLFEMARKLNLKIISIKDLVQHRLAKEILVTELEKVALPTAHGTFSLHIFKNGIDDQICFALSKGLPTDQPVLTRIHSECFTGDVFGSYRCDCGDQLEMAMKQLEAEQSGLLIYLKQEGRGIGLLNKMKAYKIQENGFDTVQANHQLGFPDDLRDYIMASQVLRYLNIESIRLLTNNPHKINNLKNYGVNIHERVSIEAPIHQTNQKYLLTKKQKMGHFISGL